MFRVYSSDFPEYLQVMVMSLKRICVLEKQVVTAVSVGQHKSKPGKKI